MSARLESLGVAHFLPLHSVERRWSDRKQVVDLPLFPGYLFAHVDPSSKSKLQVLTTPGVAGFVANSTGPLPIPDEEIEWVRRVVQSGAECSPQPMARGGDRVRVLHGPLTGVRGTLLRTGSKSHLVVSIDLLKRSVSVTVSECDIEPLAVDRAAKGL